MPSEHDVRAAIETLDAKIAEQLAPILDHPEFVRLRRTWQGLSHLVTSLLPGDTVTVRVLTVTRSEMREEFGEFRGGEWRNSPFYRRFHDMVYGGFGGEPFGLLVLDGEVDDGPADRQLLTDLSRLARACRAPVVVAASSDVSREEYPVERTHLRLTRPGHAGGRSSSWSVAAEVGRAFGYSGWFAQMEGIPVEGGSPFLNLLVAELFAKYLKCIVRDCLAGRFERDEIERGLRDWLARYTTDDEPTESRLLRGATVAVEHDLEDERHLVFRLGFRAAWGLTPLPDGVRVSGRIPR